ncbi:MAG: rRNA maturation RNase YbeY [Planctomycetes bacterium]|jgi:probable rRNA maturation factor|nr:rRNA maturation RNase YbeY [Planctomycetota bacterium]
MTQTLWNIQLDVHVDPLPAAVDTLQKAAEAALAYTQCGPATVTITIVGDAQMQQYNQRFLRHDSTTDVISFDLTDEFEPMRVFDIIVNAELAARRSRQRGHRPEAELALYIIHGLLHNLGFDDAEAQDFMRMHQTEEVILESLGFGGIYFGKKRPTEETL